MNGERRENVGYNSHVSYSQIKKDVASKIDGQKFREAEEARLREYATIKAEEKGYDSQLTELGKICCFVDVFDSIPLREQIIQPVGPFEDPRESKSFQKGYNTAKAFVENGFTKENYHAFVKNYERKYCINSSRNI